MTILTPDLEKLVEKATPGPWQYQQTLWPNTRVTTLYSTAVDDINGQSKSVAKIMDWNTSMESDAELMRIAPELAAEVLALRDLLAIERGG